MYCTIYRCRMSEESCAIRRRNAIDNPRGDYVAGRGDHNCRSCKTGEKIAQSLVAGAVESYSASLRQARQAAGDRRKARKPREPAPAPMTEMVQETPAAVAERAQPGKKRGWPKGKPRKFRTASAQAETIACGDYSTIVAALRAERDEHARKVRLLDEAIDVLTRRTQ